jgi:toxin ParE1/3/4
VSHRIEFSPEALGDLIDLYDYIALRDGAERVIGYIDRIEDCCRNLSVFPERGIKRDDLRRGFRVLGFERRAVIAFLVAAYTVTILRILYGGRDLETLSRRSAVAPPDGILAPLFASHRPIPKQRNLRAPILKILISNKTN